MSKNDRPKDCICPTNEEFICICNDINTCEYCMETDLATLPNYNPNYTL